VVVVVFAGLVRRKVHEGTKTKDTEMVRQMVLALWRGAVDMDFGDNSFRTHLSLSKVFSPELSYFTLPDSSIRSEEK
jgi:hypothetical protein